MSEFGLHGALIHVPNQEPSKNLRHISPRELALLCGFDIAEGWQADQRLLLAGIGQIASPIHSAWVFGHIRQHLGEMQYAGITVHRPREIVACVCMELFDLRNKWFGPYMSVAMNMFQESIEQMLEPQKLALDEVIEADAREPGPHPKSAHEAMSGNATSTGVDADELIENEGGAPDPLPPDMNVMPENVRPIPGPNCIGQDGCAHMHTGRAPCPTHDTFQAMPGDENLGPPAVV